MAASDSHAYARISARDSSLESNAELGAGPARDNAALLDGAEAEQQRQGCCSGRHRTTLIIAVACIAAALALVAAAGGTQRLPVTPKGKQMMEEVLITDPGAGARAAAGDGNWVLHRGLNCVNSQGADVVPGLHDPVSQALSVEQCKALCKQTLLCEGLLVTHGMDPGPCWLRTNVDPRGCLTNSPWDLWARIPGTPAMPGAPAAPSTQVSTAASSTAGAPTTTSVPSASTSLATAPAAGTAAPPSTTSSSANSTPPRMTFYMYRAQSDAEYDLVNINAANLAGVLLYLHNEVVQAKGGNCTRHYDITRILRFKVTMMTTMEIFGPGPQHFNFMPYVAIDRCSCTVPDCDKIWSRFGYAPGCQHSGFGLPGNFNYPNMIWYSLPGPCMSQSCGAKSASCRANEPGGKCDRPDGSHTCTWNYERAGEISVDELAGIHDRQAFCRAGHLEYDAATDRGTGTSFWNGRSNATLCAARMRAVRQLFDRKYPNSKELPDPVC